MCSKEDPAKPRGGAIGLCRAAPGIDRVPELYPEDILRKPVYNDPELE